MFSWWAISTCRAARRSHTRILSVLGPVTLAGGRSQVVLLGGQELPRAVASALAPLRGRRRLGARTLTVDVDPVEL